MVFGRMFLCVLSFVTFLFFQYCLPHCFYTILMLIIKLIFLLWKLLKEEFGFRIDFHLQITTGIGAYHINRNSFMLAYLATAFL